MIVNSSESGGATGQLLHAALDYLPVIGVFALIILCSNYFLYISSKSELAPQEDQGIIISLIATAPTATLEQTQLSSRQVFEIVSGYPETDHVFQLDGISGLNSGIAGMVLKPWDERKRTTMQLNPEVQMRLAGIAGARVVSFLQAAPSRQRRRPARAIRHRHDGIL